MRRHLPRAILTLTLILGLPGTGKTVECKHPGLNAQGQTDTITAPCDEEALGGVTFGVPSPPVAYSTLQATYDLDVILIERTPRYPAYCVQWQNCPGQPWCVQSIPDQPTGPSCDPITPIGACEALVNGKRWPTALQENVTYIGHIKNHGGINSGVFLYEWLEDGQVVAGPTIVSGIGVGAGATIQLPPFSRTFPAVPKEITLRVTTGGDLFETNNELSINTHAMAIKYFVHQSIYDDFNTRQAAYSNTFGFEHWVQKHVEKLNGMLAKAIYPIVSPNGVLDRVRVDVFEVYTGSPNDVEGPENDDHHFCMDGKWNTQQSATWVDDVINQTPHTSLIHELGHFGGLNLTDLYTHNLTNRPSDNFGVQVTRADTTPLVVVDVDENLGCPLPPPRSREPLCPIVWSHIMIQGQEEGLMGGGNTYPGNKDRQVSMHSAGALNADAFERRGHWRQNYFGVHLWDTPTTNYLRVLDDSGAPAVHAQVRLFQKRTQVESFQHANDGEFIDNVAEIEGVTNAFGVLALPNRTVGANISIPTGHTLKANPFGAIHFPGPNGTFLVQISTETDEWYRWLRVHDLNLAYWLGNSDTAVHTIGPCHLAPAPDPTCDISTSGSTCCDIATDGSDCDGVAALCDNCSNPSHPNAYNPDQRDTDANGVGDACSTCVGDCNVNGAVAANEITQSLKVLRGIDPLTTCILADGDANGAVMASEFMKTISNVFGCPHAPGGGGGGATTSGASSTVDIVLADGLDLEGTVGSMVDVPISISGGGGTVSAAQVDILFYTGLSMANPAADCALAASLASTHTLSANITTEPGDLATTNRLRIAVMDHSAPFSTVADGTIATCRFKIEGPELFGHALLQVERQECADAGTNVLPSQALGTAVYVCPGCVCN